MAAAFLRADDPNIKKILKSVCRFQDFCLGTVFQTTLYAGVV